MVLFVSPLMRGTKTEIIKARVDAGLKNDLVAIARSEDVDISDLIRWATKEFVARKRQSLSPCPSVALSLS